MSGRPVLVLNCGSSSVKYRLVAGDGSALASGLVERIGESGTAVQHRRHEGADVPEDGATPVEAADHEAALRVVLDAFDRHGPSLEQAAPAAVGHRLVHGGERFRRPTVVDDEVLDAVERLTPLAPLHNPAGLAGIRAARQALPDVPHVVVFDTAFHATLPERAATYAVPQDWRERLGVRRYGFHGTSHAYVARESARLLGRPVEELAIIVLHLGNGASACAVDGGRSVDTSMGLTPLQGLVMGTRSGDVDPALPAYLDRVAGLSPQAVDDALNHDSGLLGLAGASDLREVERRAADGDARARTALDVYCYRVRCYVGAYVAALGRVDAVTFTAGVGEHSPAVRSRSLDGLEVMGIAVDRSRNEAPARGARVISPEGARVAVLVVPTDEEGEIARQVREVVAGGSDA